MEDIAKNIEGVATEVKGFKDNISELEKKNAELEAKNANFAKEIEDLKKENLENARKISEFSIKSEVKPEDGSAEIEIKYLKTLDRALRDYAKGVNRISSEDLETAERYTKTIAKKNFLSDEDLEKKFIKTTLQDADNVNFPVLEVKANPMNTFTGSEGGFMVRAPKQGPLYEILSERTSLVNLANKATTNSGQYDAICTKAVEEGFWEGEFGSDQSIGAGFDKVKISTAVVKGVVPVSRSFVEDFNGNLYSYLNTYLQQSLNNATERGLFTGDNVNGRPHGISLYDETTSDDYVFNKIKTVVVTGADDFLDKAIEQSVLLKTRKKDIIVHPTALASMLLVKDKDGRPLLQPNIYQNGADFRINGMNIYVSDYCPKMVSGAKFAYMGDFNRAYDMVERTGITLDLNPYNNNNEVIKYMLRARRGGAVKGFDSVVAFKLS